ncbi:MAG: PTS sugar transporter subunit IIA, partial [Planctomycetota bacterium]|nr:PTS sugar transporter subunit IIA [Planctomycetota bacterium]
YYRRNLERIREEVLQELTDLMDESGLVANPRRLFRDLSQREKKAGTAIGQGIAIPHVRTLQVRSFIMAFGRSREGLPFEAPDEDPVHLFFAMSAPPHEDRTYLKVYRTLAKALLHPGVISRLMEVEDPSEVLFVLKSVE